jgi:hypothetical protein
MVPAACCTQPARSMIKMCHKYLYLAPSFFEGGSTYTRRPRERERVLAESTMGRMNNKRTQERAAAEKNGAFCPSFHLIAGR